MCVLIECQAFLVCDREACRTRLSEAPHRETWECIGVKKSRANRSPLHVNHSLWMMSNWQPNNAMLSNQNVENRLSVQQTLSLSLRSNRRSLFQQTIANRDGMLHLSEKTLFHWFKNHCTTLPGNPDSMQSSQRGAHHSATLCYRIKANETKLIERKIPRQS